MIEFLLNQIPASLWIGLIAGALVSIVGYSVLLWLFGFLKRHWKAILIVCAIVGAVGIWI